eukprot:scaffold471619_cov48-Prasinocladus_malaysianus.AAC.1
MNLHNNVAVIRNSTKTTISDRKGCTRTTRYNGRSTVPTFPTGAVRQSTRTISAGTSTRLFT